MKTRKLPKFIRNGKIINNRRKPAFTVESYTGPSHWACYFVNGDDSGMDAEEIRVADKFLDFIGLGSPVNAEEIGFSWSSDASHVGYNLGSDIAEYTFLRPNV